MSSYTIKTHKLHELIQEYIYFYKLIASFKHDILLNPLNMPATKWNGQYTCGYFRTRIIQITPQIINNTINNLASILQHDFMKSQILFLSSKRWYWCSMVEICSFFSSKRNIFFINLISKLFVLYFNWFCIRNNRFK